MHEFLQELMNHDRRLMALGVALLLGALIGIQRGWKDREREAGERVAGVRTHTLTALMGGLGAILAEHLGQWVLASLLVSLALIGAVAYRRRTEAFRDYSITGLIGLILTFLFGALAAMGELEIAASSAVVTALLLDNKAEIHSLLNKLRSHELEAGLKLLLISVVVLPLLPDRGFGPGQAINPFQVWWMVVLIASISFIGYFAIRVGGAQRGILFIGLFAGLTASTPLTLHFSRLSRNEPELAPLLAAGILFACGTMFPRILLLCGILNPSLVPPLALPALLMMTLLYVPALLIWYRHRRIAIEQPTTHQNPLELGTAIGFGAVLMVVMLLSQLLRTWFGDAGIYLLAAASGLADVDAVTLSLTQMSGAQLALGTVVAAIIIAASVNSLVKATMASVLGDRRLAWRVAAPMVLAIGCGLAVALMSTRLG